MTSHQHALAHQVAASRTFKTRSPCKGHYNMIVKRFLREFRKENPHESWRFTGNIDKFADSKFRNTIALRAKPLNSITSTQPLQREKTKPFFALHVWPAFHISWALHETVWHALCGRLCPFYLLRLVLPCKIHLFVRLFSFKKALCASNPPKRRTSTFEHEVFCET